MLIIGTQVEFKNISLHYTEKGIIRHYVHENKTLTMDDMIETFNYVDERREGEKFCNLLVIPPSAWIGSEVQKQGADPKYNLFNIAEALVINSIAHRILGNFYLALMNRNKIPTRIFNQEEKALIWLRDEYAKYQKIDEAELSL